jgi:hypothetical protein
VCPCRAAAPAARGDLILRIVYADHPSGETKAAPNSVLHVTFDSQNRLVPRKKPILNEGAPEDLAPEN